MVFNRTLFPLEIVHELDLNEGMKSFPRYPEYGRTAWAVATEKEPLPKGLDHRSPIQIILRNDADFYLVMDQQGRDWWLPHWKIDSGHSYLIAADREWVSEQHPAVQEYLSAFAARLEAEGDPSTKDEIDRIEWILHRSQIRFIFPGRKSWEPSFLSV